MSQIQIKTIESKTQWEDFALSQPQVNFLSSYNWGEFNSNMGKKIYRLGIFDNQTLVGVCLVVKETAKRGNYLTIAGGPIINWQDSSFTTLVAHLKKIAKRENCWFIRIRPQILNNPQNQRLFKSHGFMHSPMHLSADLTLQLDTTQPSEQILAQMRKNTRYEIKKSQKLGIQVKKSTDPKDIKEFNNHQQALAKKHHFVPFSEKFLTTQFQSFVQDDQVILFHSYLENKLLASAFVIYYGQEAVYHYGISTPDNHHLPGAYATLWAAILEAQERHYTRFNFWGIAPADQPNHRFWGVRVFKTGFGGEEVAYLPSQDLPTSPLYFITRAFEKYRAKSRNLA